MQLHAMDKARASFLLLLFVLLTASYPAAVNAAPAGSQQQGNLSTNIVTDAINVSYGIMVVGEKMTTSFYFF